MTVKIEKESPKACNRGFEEKKKDSVDLLSWSKESTQAFVNVKEETVDIQVDQVKSYFGSVQKHYKYLLFSLAIFAARRK
jgi:hypothetical protein